MSESDEGSVSDKHGMVWWSELMTRDVESAKKFYEKSCGWKYSTMPMAEGEYTVANRGDVPTAGIMDMTHMENLADAPPHWFTYFAVADINEAMGAVRADGGNVMREPFDVEGIGTIAIVADPTGAALGFIQPAEQPQGN